MVIVPQFPDAFPILQQSVIIQITLKQIIIYNKSSSISNFGIIKSVYFLRSLNFVTATTGGLLKGY